MQNPSKAFVGAVMTLQAAHWSDVYHSKVQTVGCTKLSSCGYHNLTASSGHCIWWRICGCEIASWSRECAPRHHGARTALQGAPAGSR